MTYKWTWIPTLSMGALYIYSFLNSGAFEVYINENLEFSKLVTGRMITEWDIRAIFSKYGVKIQVT